MKRIAEAAGLPVYQPVSLRNRDQQVCLAGLEADVLVVVAYGLILPQAVLDAPRLGCLNVHASLLPRWRGAAPYSGQLRPGIPRPGLPSCKWTPVSTPAPCWPAPAALSTRTYRRQPARRARPYRPATIARCARRSCRLPGRGAGPER